MLILDTHILLFVLSGELKPNEAKRVSESDCSVSVAVLWEINKLHQLNRIAVSQSDPGLLRLLNELTLLPITVEVCRCLPQLDFSSDPIDEIIAATSIAHGFPLLTRDRKILASKVVPLAR